MFTWHNILILPFFGLFYCKQTLCYFGMMRNIPLCCVTTRLAYKTITNLSLPYQAWCSWPAHSLSHTHFSIKVTKVEQNPKWAKSPLDEGPTGSNRCPGIPETRCQTLYYGKDSILWVDIIHDNLSAIHFFPASITVHPMTSFKVKTGSKFCSLEVLPGLEKW